LAGSLVATAADGAATSPGPLGPLGLPIGSQVYPLRSRLQDFPAFVKMMAGIGVTGLELCSPIGYGREFASLTNGKEVRRILADHGMKAEVLTSPWGSCATVRGKASSGRRKLASRRW
jgi:hypothetical protein